MAQAVPTLSQSALYTHTGPHRIDAGADLRLELIPSMAAQYQRIRPPPPSQTHPQQAISARILAALSSSTNSAHILSQCAPALYQCDSFIHSSHICFDGYEFSLQLSSSHNISSLFRCARLCDCSVQLSVHPRHHYRLMATVDSYGSLALRLHADLTLIPMIRVRYRCRKQHNTHLTNNLSSGKNILSLVLSCDAVCVCLTLTQHTPSVLDSLDEANQRARLQRMGTTVPIQATFSADQPTKCWDEIGSKFERALHDLNNSAREHGATSGSSLYGIPLHLLHSLGGFPSLHCGLTIHSLGVSWAVPGYRELNQTRKTSGMFRLAGLTWNLVIDPRGNGVTGQSHTMLTLRSACR